MAILRFVHASDLHLDRPFRGIRDEAPDYVAQALSNATFDVYQNIIDLCITERVDALLVAGDIYDAADRSLRAQLRFIDGLKQLDRAGIASFICHGNHDPLDGWQARLDLPPSCVRFGPQVEGHPLFPGDPQRGMVYGMSYPTREVRENLAPYFAAMKNGQGFKIGLLHANVGGNQDHDPYAPCSVDDLIGTGFDYWALGHVHTRQMLRESGPTIVYPGNPQGLHTNEEGSRGVYLVEIDDHGGAHLEFRPMDVVRWSTLSVDIGALESEQELLDIVDDLADGALEEAEGRSVVAHLKFIGRGGLHRWVNIPGTVEEIREQLNNRFARTGTWLWCEGAQVTTRSLVDRDAALQREDFVGDLVRISSESQTNAQVVTEFRRLLEPLYSHRDIRRLLGEFQLSDDEIRDLLADAESECLDALVEDE